MKVMALRDDLPGVPMQRHRVGQSAVTIENESLWIHRNLDLAPNRRSKVR
jgi:hypothetical protein